MLIGKLSPRVEQYIKQYGPLALEMVLQANQQLFGSANCQDWVLHLLQSLETNQMIPAGTYSHISNNVPRHG